VGDRRKNYNHRQPQIFENKVRKERKKMEETSYVNIQDWMLELDLSLPETVILAVIYGFSQDGRSKFSGSLSYLQKWTRLKSKTSVMAALKTLVEKQIISKHDKEINGVKLCDYSYNVGVYQKLIQGIPKIDTHNIEDKNIEEKENYIKEKEEQKRTIEQQAIEVYKAYPRHVGKPLAIRAIKTALKSISFEELIKRTRDYAEAVKRSHKDLQYIPMPSTWFNQERYNDDISEQLPSNPYATGRVERVEPIKPRTKAEILRDEPHRAQELANIDDDDFAF
jgi:hypothetical protein